MSLSANRLLSTAQRELSPTGQKDIIYRIQTPLKYPDRSADIVSEAMSLCHIIAIYLVCLDLDAQEEGRRRSDEWP